VKLATAAVQSLERVRKCATFVAVLAKFKPKFVLYLDQLLLQIRVALVADTDTLFLSPALLAAAKEEFAQGATSNLKFPPG
jgi:hypothetical protein